MLTRKYFVHPVSGKPQHGVALDRDGSSYSVSLCDRFQPEDDEARCQGYYLYTDEPHHLWRSATDEERDEILAALDPELLESLLHEDTGQK